MIALWEGRLSVSFSDIYTVKMENDVVISSKPIFYCRFVDKISNRRKLGDNVLFDQLNKYHWNIKLTLEVNPGKFLGIKLNNINGAYRFSMFIRKNKTTFIMDLQNSKTLKAKYNQWRSSSFIKNIKVWQRNPSDKRKVCEGWLPFINSVVNEF